MNMHNPPLPKLTTGTYRHNKTGNSYEVIGVALHTESGEAMVVYRPLYDHSDHELYVRPYVMFTEQVVINGQSMPRFEKIDSPRTYIA